MRKAIVVAVVLVAAGCAGHGDGPILMEVRPDGAAAPVLTSS